MKAALYLLIALHGTIHLFGFLKAFKINDFSELTLPISKPLGIVWLACSLLFGLTLFLNYKEHNYWWAAGIAAIIISQILIIIFWQDAKMGTLPNVILLLVCIIGWSAFNFTKKIEAERNAMLSVTAQNPLDLQHIDSLPKPVQKWLSKNGFPGKESIQNVYLRQKIKMKLKPEQDEWYIANADQYFTVNPPAFNWSIDLQMNPFFAIRGRDRFETGKGEMLMKMFSFIPVVDVKDNFKINQAALQRYLAEIIWFPSAALSPYIKWEQLDEHSAKATITHSGTTGSGVFYFNENGDFVKFSAMRYKDSDDAAKKYEWIAEVLENRVINEINIPSKLKVTWKLEHLDWTWLELEITELKYNI